MIAKEWCDARWKFLIAAAIALLAAAVPSILMSYGEIKGFAPAQPERWAATEMWALYSAGGFFVLLPLAALLGVGLISGEVSSGSIFLLLSKPVSRTRLLLSKYAVCAGILLASAILGAVLIVIAAAMRGYPVGSVVNVPGLALSALLIWLGVMFVLGMALLASILFRSVASAVATVLAVLSIVALPELTNALASGVQLMFGIADCVPGERFYAPCGIPHGLYDRLSLTSYWYSESLYAGKDFVPVNFLVFIAAVPLLAAL